MHTSRHSTQERLPQQLYEDLRRGIAPFYADKYVKLGIQVADLYHERRLRERLERSLEPKNVLLEHLYGKPPVKVQTIVPALLAEGERLRPFVCDTTALLQDALA